MPRFPRSIIQSDKHEVTWSNLAQDAGTAADATNLAVAVQPSGKNLSTEVEIGSIVRSIYFEFHFSAETVTNPKVIHWTIEIVPPGLTVSNPNLYYQTDRRFIIKRGMEMLPKDVSTVFKRVFVVRIPPKYQRQSDTQIIQFRYQCSSTEAINACGIAIYKELR